MGKYMKKGKIAVIGIPQPGVRTRARTLALQPDPELSYLQLRSRRLEKLPPKHHPSSKQTTSNSKQANPSFKVGVNSPNSASASLKKEDDMRFIHFDDVGRCNEVQIEDFFDVGGEPSFGENNVEYDSTDRSTRVSTPCSLIRDSEAIPTPGSTTRAPCSSSATRRMKNMQTGTIPTPPEMEELFAGSELDQQKLFIEKYNYDIMTDLPLPGRYEWLHVDNSEEEC